MSGRIAPEGAWGIPEKGAERGRESAEKECQGALVTFFIKLLDRKGRLPIIRILINFGTPCRSLTDTAFHYLLMASQALFQRRVMAALADTGLTAGQPKVLDYLGLHDGSIQKAIAAGCLIEPATLTGLLNRMEEKGLITRRAAENDRRICRIHLTETGRAAQARVRAIDRAVGRRIQVLF